MARRKKIKRSRRKGAEDSSKVGTWIIIGVAILAVIGLISLLFLNLNDPGTPEMIEGVVDLGSQLRDHDAALRIEYGELPPAGGVHNPTWQNCGIYDEPIRPENAVHSLEHGAVWITYQPTLPAEEVSALQEQMRGQRFIILSPYPNQRSPVVASAWGLQLELEDAGDERLFEFIDQYRLGPQTPERGATCSGGVGTPIS